MGNNECKQSCMPRPKQNNERLFVFNHLGDLSRSNFKNICKRKDISRTSFYSFIIIVNKYLLKSTV